MAPAVAEATGAAVIALLLSVSPTMVTGDKPGSCNGALQSQRGRQLKVLAWGRRGMGSSSSSSSKFEVDPNRPSRSGGGGGEGGAEEATDYPKDRVVDDSWTHAAFRAFHEMRAGRPLSALVLDEEDEEEQDEQGPLSGVRGLASRLTRCEVDEGGLCFSASARFLEMRALEGWVANNSTYTWCILVS